MDSMFFFTTKYFHCICLSIHQTFKTLIFSVCLFFVFGFY